MLIDDGAQLVLRISIIAIPGHHLVIFPGYLTVFSLSASSGIGCRYSYYTRFRRRFVVNHQTNAKFYLLFQAL